MIKITKRLISILLVFTIMAEIGAAIPMAVYAAEKDRTSYEETVYTSLLEQFEGDEETARHTLNIMRQAGMLESDKSFAETAKIRLDGKLLTLDQVRMRIADGEDLSQIVYINDYAMPLADLKQIIEIEDFIEHVRKNYIENDIEMTTAHESYYGDLMASLEAGEVQLLDADAAAPDPDWYSDGTIKISDSDYMVGILASSTKAVPGQALQLEFVLVDKNKKTAQAPYDISFDWRLLSGSAKAGVHFRAASGTVTFPAGSKSQKVGVQINSSAVAPIVLTNEYDDNAIAETIRGDWRWDGDRIFYVQTYNYRNAVGLLGGTAQRIAQYPVRIRNNEFSHNSPYKVVNSPGYLATHRESKDQYRRMQLRLLPTNVEWDPRPIQSYYTGVEPIDAIYGTVVGYKDKVYAETTITAYLPGVSNYDPDYALGAVMDENIINLIHVADGWIEYERAVRYYFHNAKQVTVDATLQFSIDFNGETKKAYGTPKHFSQLTTQYLTFSQEMAADVLKWVLKYKTERPNSTWNEALSKIKIIITQKNSLQPRIESAGAPGPSFIVFDAESSWSPYDAAGEANDSPEAVGDFQFYEKYLLWKHQAEKDTKVVSITVGNYGKGRLDLGVEPVLPGAKVPVVVELSRYFANGFPKLSVNGNVYPAEDQSLSINLDGPSTNRFTYLVPVPEDFVLKDMSVKSFYNGNAFGFNSGVSNTINLTPLWRKEDCYTGGIAVTKVEGSLTDYKITAPFAFRDNVFDTSEREMIGTDVRARPVVALVSDGVFGNRRLVQLYITETLSGGYELVGNFSLPVPVSGVKTVAVELMHYPAQMPAQMNSNEDWGNRVTDKTSITEIKAKQPNGWVPLIGKRTAIVVAPLKLLKSDDFTITYDDVLDDYLSDKGEYPIYNENNALTGFNLSYKLSQNGQSADFKSPADFVWSSSDTNVATIDQNGQVTLAGNSGEVTFRLTALNGGKGIGDSVYNETRKFRIKIGRTPYISIPANVVNTRANVAAEVRWSSNLPERYNDEIRGSNKAVTFNINVYSGSEDTDITKSNLVYAGKEITTLDDFKSAHTIPGNYLTEISTVDGFSYIVEISALKPNGNAEVPTDWVRGTAKIRVMSPPATIRLKSLDNYFLTDATTSIPLNWDVTSADPNGNYALEFEVLKNGKRLYADDTKSLRDYTIDTSAAVTGLKDTYTVTLRVRNTADEALGWSYDSCVIYVYNSNALKLMVNGKDIGDTYKLSNIDRIEAIAADDPQKILDLNRDINLSADIGLNKNEYPWSDLYDQIEMSSAPVSPRSADQRFAGLYVLKDGNYRDVANDSTSSYGVKTEFKTFGFADGVTTIKAQHAYAAALADTLNVETETLRNKLYLFNFLPSTKITITHVKPGESVTAKTYTTSDDGRLAIYEPTGLYGTLYLEGVHKGTLYRGTIDAGTAQDPKLMSGETTPAEAALYPVNTVRLLPAAKNSFTLTLPDGTPYRGRVQVNAGAFKNGVYCPAAKFWIEGDSGHPSGVKINTLDVKLSAL